MKNEIWIVKLKDGTEYKVPVGDYKKTIEKLNTDRMIKIGDSIVNTYEIVRIDKILVPERGTITMK